MELNTAKDFGFIFSANFFLFLMNKELGIGKYLVVIFPDAHNEEHREILFLRETNEHIAIWEGEKLTKENATEVSGIKTVYWLSEFDRIFYGLMNEAENIYLNRNEHYRAVLEVETREDRFIKKVKKEFPLHEILRSNPILQHLRSVKEPENWN